MVFGIFDKFTAFYNMISQFFTIILVIIMLMLAVWFITALKRTGCFFIVASCFKTVVGNTVGRGKKHQIEEEEKEHVNNNNILPSSTNSYGIFKINNKWFDTTKPVIIFSDTDTNKNLSIILKNFKV